MLEEGGGNVLAHSSTDFCSKKIDRVKVNLANFSLQINALKDI